MKIVLASSSVYRKSLLTPLFPTLSCIAPNINEALHTAESAEDYVLRLAYEKSKTVADISTGSIVIAVDQCAELEGRIITKPNDHASACAQLHQASGKRVNFFTGLCVINTDTNSQQTSCETYSVTFRELTKEQIENYLRIDEPYDCAGSFKVEGLGITLFESLHGDDPNTLIGLPLIKLISMLNNEGIKALIDYP